MNQYMIRVTECVVNTRVPPVLDEHDHLRVGFTQNAFAIDLHQPVP